jgi:nucleoside 2-deoxyribosyltransferase
MLSSIPEVMKLYISGPLQSAEDLNAARTFYEALAKACDEDGWDVYLPHQNTDPIRNRTLSEAVVFDRDLEALYAADVVAAYIGRASSGVGAELGIAFSRKQPILGFYQRNERPSRFILGMLERSGQPVISFDDISDCCARVQMALRDLRPARCIG